MQLGSTGTATFDATRDADASPSSGSAELSTDGASNSAVTLSRCFNVVPGENVVWGGRLRYREGEVAVGSMFTVAVFHSGSGCTGTTLGVGGTQLLTSTSTRGIWLDSNFPSALGFTAPDGTQSVALGVRVNKTGAGALTINADKLFFARVSSPRCNGQIPTLVGTSEGEKIEGTDGTDIIAGLGGADVLRGYGGFDTLCGGAGDDTLRSGGQSDILLGGPGDDVLLGGAGSDVLRGGPGFDDCNGEAGSSDTGSSCEVSSNIP
jgi:Ca2+-binding RTX toxin-like protein